LSKHFQKTLYCEKDRRFQIPYQPSGRRVIPSRHPSVHCLIRPDNVSSRPDARQTSIICPNDVSSRPDPTLYREASVHLDTVRTSQQPFRMSISDRSASDSFQVQNMGRLIHSPNDVVSRPDAIINKATIAIQISPSGRQSALVRTCGHQLRKLSI
jgi:hypothetical protein